MTRRNILLTILLVLFLSTFYFGGKGSFVLTTLFLVIMVGVSVYDWYQMQQLEKDILVKFKVEYNRNKIIKDALTGILYASILIFIFYLISLSSLKVEFGNLEGPDLQYLWFFVIVLNVSNLIFYYKYYNCVLTNNGLYDSKSVQPLSLSKYDDYHYEVEHKSFILSKNGVETMELIPKTPVEPHVSVLIDWFESQLRTGK